MDTNVIVMYRQVLASKLCHPHINSCASVIVKDALTCTYSTLIISRTSKLTLDMGRKYLGPRLHLYHLFMASESSCWVSSTKIPDMYNTILASTKNDLIFLKKNTNMKSSR